MPLSMTKVGEEVILMEILWSSQMRKRLEDMGLTPGVRMSVVSSDLNGTLIVNVRGSRLVLDGSITKQIIVRSI